MSEEKRVPSVKEVVHRLVDVLGPTITGVTAGLPGPAPVKTWMVRPPNVEQEAKLRTAYEVVELIAANESPEIALIWMCGMNPHLADDNPAFEIGRGNGRDVLIAARSYVQDPSVT